MGGQVICVLYAVLSNEVQKGHNYHETKFESKCHANMIIYVQIISILTKKFHKNMFSDFRGVALTKNPTKTWPMGHIGHLRKQFKSINTYHYIITLIKRRKNHYVLYEN